ncbi:MAG: hypothetical protein RL431_922 [Actinomycetota bacterium]|jgi:hypothetical protein
MSAKSAPHDHESHSAEVIERWGQKAYDIANSWWSGLDAEARADFLRESSDLSAAWIAAAASHDIQDDEVRALVLRHSLWITRAWGGVEPTREQLVGLGDMYVADERFAANYGGAAGAQFVRDAIALHA